MIPTGRLKDTATRMDIVNDFYDAIQRLQNTFKDQREAQMALAVLEDLAIWWANTVSLQHSEAGMTCECLTCGRQHHRALGFGPPPWALNYEDACRLSVVFNEVANLGRAQDAKINEWLKKLIVSTRSSDT